MIGIPAALTVVWVGDRFGQLAPLTVALILSITGLIGLLFPSGKSTYVAAIGVYGLVWCVVALAIYISTRN